MNKLSGPKCSICKIILIFFLFSGQSLITYLLLAVTYLSLYCCQKTHLSHSKQSLWTVFKRRGLRYFFLAVADVEANYLMHRAFHYTTLTSVQVSHLNVSFSLVITTLQMFAGIYRGFAGILACGDFKFTGITCYPHSLQSFLQVDHIYR